jgi:hypothetical protein
MDDKSSVLKFAALTMNDATAFIFMNTCSVPPPIPKIFEKNFTTKHDGKGMGLYVLRLILDENDNTSLETTIKDGEFIQRLVIY